jgi:hypothetical protein
VPFARDLAAPPAEAGRAVRAAAEGWGAELEPEGAGPRTLHLPVVAGLRRGLVSGALALEANGSGSRLVFTPSEERYWLRPASVVVLALSAVGALLAVLWPFYPDLLSVAPFGVLLALGGWFLVLTRIRNAGPEEFLQDVERAVQEGGDGEDDLEETQPPE